MTDTHGYGQRYLTEHIHGEHDEHRGRIAFEIAEKAVCADLGIMYPDERNECPCQYNAEIRSDRTQTEQADEAAEDGKRE